MALNVCLEAFFRIFFELLKYSIDNFIFVIITLVIISFFSRMFGGIILALIAAAGDFIVDSGFLATAGTTTIVSVLAGLGIGMIWAMMVLTAREIPLLIKIPNAIVMFMMGTIIGLIPFPPLAVASLVIAAILRFSPRIGGYFIGIIAASGLYMLMSIASPLLPFMCEGINYVATLF